ncbi:MAG: TRAP transporter large permease subunit [Calothrix sp. SM1_5_4]|nr:TRAP transporter large permease subunit [Calothrix sp. SM1_5_4]
MLSFIFTRENVGPKLVALVLGLSLPSTAVIFLILIVVLILGCFIDGTALMILFLPIVMPLINAIGYPLVAFGIIFILTTVMGILTPPFGLGLYIGAEITGLSFQRTVKSVMPFLIPLFVSVVIMVFFPQIVTFLPSILVK